MQEKGVALAYDPVPPKPQLILAPTAVISDVDHIRAYVMQYVLDALVLLNVQRPAPKGQTIQMNITRIRSGMKKLYPEYHLSFKDGVCDPCFPVERRFICLSSNFVVQVESERSLLRRTIFFLSMRRTAAAKALELLANFAPTLLAQSLHCMMPGSVQRTQKRNPHSRFDENSAAFSMCVISVPCVAHSSRNRMLLGPKVRGKCISRFLP